MNSVRIEAVSTANRVFRALMVLFFALSAFVFALTAILLSTFIILCLSGMSWPDSLRVLGILALGCASIFAMIMSANHRWSLRQMLGLLASSAVAVCLLTGAR